MHANFIIPNFYAQSEPSSSVTSEPDNSIIINLDTIKQSVSSYLKKKNAVVYILIDKLDEFVVKEKYETQKELIQALLYCQRSYAKHPSIKLKLFLRSDLFERLDYTGLGYDKIINKTVKLVWSEEEIREFLSRRIFYNLIKCLSLDSLSFSIDEKKLYLGKQALLDGFITGESPVYKNGMIYPIKKLYWKIRSRLAFIGIDARDARKTNFNDEINKQIITSIFPRAPNHYDNSKTKKPIDLFEYFSTHFCLGSGHATPRIILMYIQSSLEHSLDYFEKNMDKRHIVLDVYREYPLIMRDCMLTSYHELQEKIWNTVAHIDKQWKRAILLIKENKDCISDAGVSFKNISALVAKHISEQDELTRFLAFSTHIGLFSIINQQVNSIERQYKLPVLLQ